MVLFNYSTKELTAKIVYYGPGLCGKTTNLQYIFSNLPPNVNKGKMLSLATQTDRTLFFDFLPIDLGTIRGMKTRLQLYTVPGQVFYNTTRKLVLKGADGLVFVGDSQRKMLEADVESFGNLEENLKEHGMELSQIPHVIQFNKRDLGDVLSPEELNAALNKYNAPIYEAVATTGIGVHDTLKAVTRLVLNSLKEKYEGKKAAAKPAAAQQAVAAAEAAAPAPALRASAARPAPPTRQIEQVEEVEVLEVVEDAVLEVSEEADAGPALSVEPQEVALEIEPEPVLEVQEEADAAEASDVIEIVDEEPEVLEVIEEAAAATEDVEEIEEIHEIPEIEEEAVQVLPVEEIPEAGLEMETGISEPEPVELSVEETPTELDSLVEEEPLLAPPVAGPATAPDVFPGGGGVPDGSTVAVQVETRNMPAAVVSGPVKTISPGEISFPLSLKVQGRTVTVRVTVSIQLEQP